mgnify:CR=1 FL=1
MDDLPPLARPKLLSEVRFNIDEPVSKFKEYGSKTLGNLKTLITTAPRKFLETLKNSNIVGLIISIIIAFYVSDAVYYLVDSHIMKPITHRLKHLDPAIIKIGGIKIRSRKLVKKIVRFCVLTLILIVILFSGMSLGLIKN